MHECACVYVYSSHSSSVLMVTIILTHVGNDEHAVGFIESHKRAVCLSLKIVFFFFAKKFTWIYGIFHDFPRCFAWKVVTIWLRIRYRVRELVGLHTLNVTFKWNHKSNCFMCRFDDSTTMQTVLSIVHY